MSINGPSFEGKNVLITGASLGIGAALARAFAQAGANVGIGYRSSAAEASALHSEIVAGGGNAVLLQGDVTEPGELADVISGAREEFGSIDVLINNAGALVGRSPIDAAPDDLYEQIMALNVRSMFEACRAVIPEMRERGSGNIINLTSIAARTGGAGGSVLYASAKGAVATFTRGLAAELAPFGIRVNALSPGLIRTPFHEGGVTSPEHFAKMEEGIPMSRAGTAEECVGPTLFLASDEMASYVTGQMLEVNGGLYRP
jgi:3-oxoacyl-[acyl-carrier protein] reductase